MPLAVRNLLVISCAKWMSYAEGLIDRDQPLVCVAKHASSGVNAPAINAIAVVEFSHSIDDMT